MTTPADMIRAIGTAAKRSTLNIDMAILSYQGLAAGVNLLTEAARAASQPIGTVIGMAVEFAPVTMVDGAPVTIIQGTPVETVIVTGVPYEIFGPFDGGGGGGSGDSGGGGGGGGNSGGGGGGGW